MNIRYNGTAYIWGNGRVETSKFAQAPWGWDEPQAKPGVTTDKTCARMLYSDYYKFKYELADNLCSNKYGGYICE